MSKKNIMLLYFYGLVFFVLLTAAGCSENEMGAANRQKEQKNEIIVSAAMSLKGPLEELKNIYTQDRQGADMIFNFAASGVLRKQIERGAPADLFISADSRHIDELSTEGIILEDSRQELFYNTIVLITLPENEIVFSFDDLTDDRVSHISLGNPETVPGGKYAYELLNFLGLWENIKEKIVFAKDVRQVATYVETGNAAAGIVYKTDVTAGVVIRDNAPAGLQSNIAYTAGVVEDSGQKKAAGDFLDFLQSPEAQKVFARHGFMID